MKNSLHNSIINNQSIRLPSALFTAGYQWYERNVALFNMEKKAMWAKFPQAQLGYLPDKRMMWTVQLPNFNNIRGINWTLVLIYDTDHPSNIASGSSSRWSGSVKVYPANPSYDQLRAMAIKAGRISSSSNVPHILTDSFGRHYLCTFHPEDFKTGTITTSGLKVLGQAIRWGVAFLTGLKDQRTWNDFEKHDDQF